MNKFEQIRKLRMLERESPYEAERIVAKKKADALEKDIVYEEWMGELSEILKRNIGEENAEELMGLVLEKYYGSGYAGRYSYQEFLKEGVCAHFDKDYYHHRCNDEKLKLDDQFDIIMSEEEDMRQTAFIEYSRLARKFLEEKGILV